MYTPGELIFVQVRLRIQRSNTVNTIQWIMCCEIIAYTVKSAHVVTSIKSPVLESHLFLAMS
jgi:hypothetical protein